MTTNRGPAGVNRRAVLTSLRPDANNTGSSGDRFRLPVNKTVRKVRRRCRSGWGSHSGGPTMTEYTVKEIGHQWILYADRQSIATCAENCARSAWRSSKPEFLAERIAD